MVYSRYDNPYWEFHLPINPAPSPNDIDIDGRPYVYQGPTSVPLGNWYNDEGELVHRNRLPIGLEKYRTGHRMMTLAGDDDAPELDEEYIYDCD